MARGLKRSAAIVGFGAVATLVATVAVGWACTPAAHVSTNPSAGPPGSGVTVSGTGFSNGAVEVRWNHRGGRVLGTANGPSFSIRVNVPGDATPDVHYVVGVSTSSGYHASASFTVTRGTAASPGSESAPTSSSGSAGSQEFSRRRAADRSRSAGPGGSQAPSPGGPSAGAPAASGGGVGSAPGRSGAVLGSGGQGGATAQSSKGFVANGSAGNVPDLASEPAPSLRTVADDIWGGVASGPSLSRGPSLGGPGGDQSNTGLGLGMGLALLGGFVSLSGIGLAELSKRRVARLAQSPSASSAPKGLPVRD